MQKLFGRTYDDTVGSIEKDLILKTRGEVKIQVGKRFIDLIKNGKIVRDGSNYLFKTVSSLDDMSSDGIYIYDGDVYVRIDGLIVRVCTYDEDIFVSYLDLQDTTYDLKEIARRNIGLEFNNLVEALNSVKKGFVFVGDKIYYINNGIPIEFGGGLNLNYSINYPGSSGGGSYGEIDNEGSSSGEGDGSSPNNLPEPYDEMKILETNEEIMITTIMFVVENASLLSSIKSNGVFLKIIDKNDNKINFIPEGEYNRPITNLSNDAVNVTYTDEYKNLMHKDMHVRFHHFDYIRKDDFKTCIVSLNLELTNIPNYYIIYSYGFSYENFVTAYEPDGTPSSEQPLDSPTKLSISISFPSSYIEVNGSLGSTTIHNCQEYIVNPSNLDLDASNFTYYFDNNTAPVLSNVVLLDDNNVGSHTIKIKFTGNNLYNAAEATYTLNYILNDSRQEADLLFDEISVTIKDSSPKLVQELDLPNGIVKSDLNWKIVTKEGKEVLLDADSSGNVAIPYQGSEEVTVYAEFKGNSIYKAKTISYTVQYEVTPDTFRVYPFGLGVSVFNNGGEDFRNPNSYTDQNGSFTTTFRFTGTVRDTTSFLDTINMRIDGRDGNPSWLLYCMIDNWGSVLFAAKDWRNYSGSSDSLSINSTSVSDYKFNASFNSTYIQNLPFILNGGWTSKMIRIPASGTNGYKRILIIRNLGHFIPRYGKYYLVAQYDGGTFENYLLDRWKSKNRKENPGDVTNSFVRSMSEDLSYNLFVNKRMKHNGPLRLDPSNYDPNSYEISFNTPDYPETTDTSFDYLPQGYEFDIEEGIDMADEDGYIYPSNDRYLKYKFGENNEDGIRDYPITIYDTVSVHFIQENRSLNRVYYGTYNILNRGMEEYFERDYGYNFESDVPSELFSVLNSKIIEKDRESVTDSYSKSMNDYYICVPNGITFSSANSFTLVDSNYMWGDQRYKIYRKNISTRYGMSITFIKN